MARTRSNKITTIKPGSSKNNDALKERLWQIFISMDLDESAIEDHGDWQDLRTAYLKDCAHVVVPSFTIHPAVLAKLFALVIEMDDSVAGPLQAALNEAKYAAAE